MVDYTDAKKNKEFVNAILNSRKEKLLTKQTITQDEHRKVAKMMTEWGGSFVEALGEALLLADADNAERIKKAFPELWNKYFGMSEHEQW